METVYIILIAFFSSIVFSGLFFLVYSKFLIWFIYLLPKDNPQAFLKKLSKEKKQSYIHKRIVFIGDSITHGNLSINYINKVKEKLNGKNFDYINAGVNAELAYNVLNRLNNIIACEPDIITILIGTNDANRELAYFSNNNSITKRLQLPQQPNKKWYLENLEQIILRLKKETNSKIALCSLPIMGEDFSSRGYKQSADYALAIKQIAKKHNINYLPVNESMHDYLMKNPSHPKYPFEHRLMEKAAAMRFLFGISLDKISKKWGFTLLVDHIHLNSLGAQIVADLMVDFIKENG